MQETPADTPPPLKKESLAKPYNAGPDEWPRKKSSGSGWILAVAILQGVGSLVYYGMSQLASEGSSLPGLVPARLSPVTLGIMLALAFIFLGFWFWSKKAPFPALLTTLIVFLTIHGLEAVVQPASLLRGIIVKVIVIAGLCTALKKAYVEKREKELEPGQT